MYNKAWNNIREKMVVVSETVESKVVYDVWDKVHHTLRLEVEGKVWDEIWDKVGDKLRHISREL